mmetsp:Transcript_23470/g.51482  ORF Transcript_23470/g.51482 Transcript_23470/m.51482 type:complete len:363 (+) Transcript_23470:191-1279(+)
MYDICRLDFPFRLEQQQTSSVRTRRWRLVCLLGRLLGLLLHASLPDRHVHRQADLAGNPVGELAQSPKLDSVGPVRRDTVLVADVPRSGPRVGSWGGDGDGGSLNFREFGGHEEGGLALHVDVVGLQLPSQSLREHLNEALGAGVLSEQRRRTPTGTRAGVHDGAPLPLDHAGRGAIAQDDAGHPHRGVDVELNEARDLVVLELVEILCEGVGHADVVDQHTNIKLAHLVLDSLPSSLVEVAVVDGKVFHLDLRVLLEHLGLDLLQLLLGTRDQQDVQTLARQLEGIGTTDAIGSASDNGPLAVLFEVFARPKEEAVDCHSGLHNATADCQSGQKADCLKHRLSHFEERSMCKNRTGSKAEK